MDNKNIFASNLKKYMELNGRSRNDISNALGISYFTITDWVNGKKYPRMDKVEMLANYFGIQKSDLIEDTGQKNSPEEPKLSEGEKMLLDLFRRVPNEQQQLVLQMIRVALGSQE
ncbi:MAG: helix-turn-helix transcriptional regulator [Clostridia bacterium]|nr:helix-turn-helix transcriptional regulator [Clostridia bacterium]